MKYYQITMLYASKSLYGDTAVLKVCFKSVREPLLHYKSKYVIVWLDKFYVYQTEDKMMKHIKSLDTRDFKKSLQKGGCGECQTSCQSACKTSCTVGNQSCEQVKSSK